MMKTRPTPRLSHLFAAVALIAGTGSVHGAPVLTDKLHSQTLRAEVAGDCYQIGQQIADKSGAQLLRAMPSTENGKAVCVVVIAEPSTDGGRPKRKQIVVDQN